MAYVDTAGNRNRTGPIAAVIAIHAGIGFVLVSGLSTVVMTTIEKEFGAVEFPIDPPDEPEKPRPEPQPDATIDERFTAPDPLIILPREVPVEVEPADLPEFDEVILIPKSVPTPDVSPVVRFDPKPVKPRNDPSRWVTTNDYPGVSLRRGEAGVAGFRLEISASGRVDSCVITKSSGSAQLDAATCRYVSKRAKFHPARDSSDRPVGGRYESSVSWVIPD